MKYKTRAKKVRGGYQTYIDGRCICQYCGFDGKRSAEDWVQLQIDHLIPRRLSGKYKDDPLNLVVSCYYCNIQKREFDPSYGELVKITDESKREELIQIVTDYLIKKKDRIWGDGGGLKGSYLHMMEDLKRNSP